MALSRTSLAAGFFALGSLSGCAGPSEPKEPMGVLPTAVTSAEPLWLPFSFRAGERVALDPREGRLTEIRRLTHDGRSGSPTWHPSGRAIAFERRDAAGCAHVMAMDLGSGEVHEVVAEGCAAGPVYRGEALVVALSGQAPRCTPLWVGAPPADCDLVGPGRAPLAPTPQSDLEPFARGQVVVFTSLRDGDPELYRLEAGAVTRLTQKPGYDGGASLSPDGTRLAWHASRAPEPEAAGLPAEIASPENDGQSAAAAPPSAPPSGARGTAIYLAGDRGQHPQMVADFGRLDVDPAFLADSRRLLFASDYDAPAEAPALELELYLVDPEGAVTADGRPRLERVTFSPGYDGEASPSPDGEHILFTSSRGETAESRDVYVARWRELD